MPKSDIQHKNRLADEKSPYLLQHAHNPVDWYPWCDEAFEKARKEDKPVFLSIGYSTCHWCHVMAHESFEDEEVAKLMNEYFVSVKVDREERPDIDNIYMTVCQATTGSGGWPLSIIMTPDKKPFFAGTYFPKQGRLNRPGMLEIVPQIARLWQTARDRLVSSGEEITRAIRESFTREPGERLGKSIFESAYIDLERQFDEKYGGFRSEPKFPTPHNFLFLLRYWKRNNEEHALEMVENTLNAIRIGGIYDHVGFGVHRYSTDRRWLTPHFEKMLYDQGMNAFAYIEAYQAVGKEAYAKTAREIFTYVLRDLTSPEGGFYSAEDADSEGEEGKFYVWLDSEIDETLGDDAETFKKIFGVKKDGNYKDEAAGRMTGRNILHMAGALDEMPSYMRMTWDELEEFIEKCRKKLFKEREKRVRPHKDDKILTDWNSLMIAALARGGAVLGEKKFIEAAEKAMGFILKHLRPEKGRLLHRYRDGEAAIPAHLGDYAFLLLAFVELYEAVFDPEYLRLAREAAYEMIDLFHDNKNGGFFLTAENVDDIPARTKEVYDGAMPSGNSAAFYGLMKLSLLLLEPDLETTAVEVERALSGQIERVPAAHTYFLTGLDFAVHPRFEAVIVGRKSDKAVQEMLSELHSGFYPGGVALFKDVSDKDELISKVTPYTGEMKTVDGKAAAYVCKNYACREPVTGVEKMKKEIESV